MVYGILRYIMVVVIHSTNQIMMEMDLQRTDKYYLYGWVNSSDFTTDSATGLVNFGTNAFQFGWGNYDNYHVENLRRIVVRTNGD